MKKGNSDDAFDQTICSFSLQTTEHCSVVRSQYRHAEAESDAPQSLAMLSTTPREGVCEIRCGATTVVGIRSSAAKSSACLSLSLPPLAHPSISFPLQIEP